MPGRKVALPHEKSDTPGVELEPAEMQVLIDKDRAAFNGRAKALHEAGMAAVAAADAKDPQKLFEVGEQIERACETCHMAYWYPNEKIPTVPNAPR
jgi:cytochrome c556